MSRPATDALQDALDATKGLLLPFDAGRWIRLAVIAFFVGGLGSAPQFNAGVGGETPGPIEGQALGRLAPDAVPVIVGLVVLAVLLALAFTFVGAVMEFVLVEALATRAVEVRRPFRDHLGDGARLFGFRVFLVLVGVAVIGGAAALGLLLQGPGVRFLPVLFAAPVALVVVPVLAVVNGFTNVFVVPTMLAQETGLVAGWRRFWTTLSDHWTEFGVYLLLSVVLSLVGGAAVATVVGIVAVLVFLPVGLFGFAGVLAGVSGASTVLLLVVLVPLVLAALFALAAVGAVVSVPVVTVLRYYALFVLGATDPALDLVADIRTELESADQPGEATARSEGEAPARSDGEASDEPPAEESPDESA